MYVADILSEPLASTDAVKVTVMYSGNTRKPEMKCLLFHFVHKVEGERSLSNLLENDDHCALNVLFSGIFFSGRIYMVADAVINLVHMEQTGDSLELQTSQL